VSATLRPRYGDLMSVLVGSSQRRQRRDGDRRLECRLTWEQILTDLGRAHEAFGLSFPASRRSLARWLAAMEAHRFIHRDTKTQRDRAGRILWRLTRFTFGANGILWIKNYWKGGNALLARSIVPNVAPRFKSDGKSKEEHAVDRLSTAPRRSRPPRKARGGRLTAPERRIAQRL